MNKRILYILLILVVCFCACDPNARWETEDVLITMNIKTISAGYVECDFSTNKDAYYLIAIDTVHPDFNPYVHQKQFMMLALDSANVTYLTWRNKLLKNGEFNIAPFASHALQYGDINHFFTGLMPNTKYWVYAFVVDPDIMKPKGKLYITEIKTTSESVVDIHFDYRVKGHWDYIYPLDSTGQIYSRFPYIATTRDSVEIAQSGYDLDLYFDIWILEQFVFPEEANVYYGVKAIENDGLASYTIFEEGRTYYTAISGFDGSFKQKVVYKFVWHGDSTNYYFSGKDAVAMPEEDEDL